MVELMIHLTESARDDFNPGMSLWEFFGRVLLVSKMLKLHDRGREATASELSRLTGIPRTTVMRKLDELSKDGAVERCRHRWIIAPSFYNTPLAIEGFKRRQFLVNRAREKLATTSN
jgi:DNA-binding IclR family transcriptional regulator